jgi:plasmid stabilization system protein ParE
VADIIFHPEAQEEYEKAMEWYQARSQRAATRFEAEVEALLGRVQLNPDSFPLYDDDHRFAAVRRFPYTLIYQVHSDRIFVVAVAHARRRPDYWKRRA